MGLAWAGAEAGAAAGAEAGAAAEAVARPAAGCAAGAAADLGLWLQPRVGRLLSMKKCKLIFKDTKITKCH